MAKNFEFAMLENGLDSIASAIDHLKEDPPTKRTLKRAVRDLWQGVELVLKERLHREHWSLVFDDLDKANKTAYKAGDFVSVTFEACVERLGGVCEISIAKRDKEELRRLQKMRNRVEHFGIAIGFDAVVGSAASALDIIVEFINDHLNPEKLAGEAASLMEEIRAGVLELEAYIDQRMKKLEPQLKAVKTIVMTCPACSQGALVIYGGAECLFCHYAAADGLEAASDYIDHTLGVSRELGICPECDWETVVDLQNGGNQFPSTQYVCFTCGESWLEGSFRECSSCARLFRDREDGIGVCGGCWDVALRDD